MSLDVGHLGALLAGLASFVSPCVLPLVPPYLCFIAGITLEQLTQETGSPGRAQRQAIASAGIFALGFTTVFVALGATASVIGQLVAEHLLVLAKLAGAVIIILGLHFLGVFRLGVLERDLRFLSFARPSGLLGAYIIGLAFAFGWTPCVGPVLAAILMVAGTQDSAVRGASLLATYSLGIGIPFLLAALMARPFMAFMGRMRRHLHRVEQIMGAALVLTGIAFITGSVNAFGFWLQDLFPALGRVG